MAPLSPRVGCTAVRFPVRLGESSRICFCARGDHRSELLFTAEFAQKPPHCLPSHPSPSQTAGLAIWRAGFQGADERADKAESMPPLCNSKQTLGHFSISPEFADTAALLSASFRQTSRRNIGGRMFVRGLVGTGVVVVTPSGAELPSIWKSA